MVDFKPQTKTINLMLLDGGVGDHIASLVAVDYIYRKYPWLKLILWMPDFLTELAKNLLPEGANINGMSQMRGKYEPHRPTKTTRWDGSTSPMKIHCLSYAFLKLCDEIPAIEEQNYLRIKPDTIVTKDFNLPEKYVVITTGFTADVREWPAKEINKVIVYLLSKGVTPVFLGQKNTKTGVASNIKGSFREEIEYDKGISLIDKTTLSEAALIMENSRAVLGVDNGLLHLAGCTSAPIIGGFTTVSPEIRMPVRNNQLGWNYYPVTPDESLDCKFCQEKTNFLYGHDYRNCLFKDAKKNLCTTQMTAEKFIKHLESL